MGAIGFDNDKYVKLQSQNIRDRISKFGGKRSIMRWVTVLS